jgi:hypothetical protein
MRYAELEELAIYGVFVEAAIDFPVGTETHCEIDAS